MAAKIRKAWNWISGHKYIVTLGIFFLIIGLLDENNYIRRFKHWREISNLEKEIQHYRKLYEEDNQQLQDINSNPRELEKVAREKYFMKRADEDIYVFSRDIPPSNDSHEDRIPKEDR